MRRFFGGVTAAVLLVTGSLLITAPAQAAETTIEYAVTWDDPSTHAWPLASVCFSDEHWTNPTRPAVPATMTVTADGDYFFADQWLTGDYDDGRLAIFEGPYDPADLSNCIHEVDDRRNVSLTAGTTYTVFLTGYSRGPGSFGFNVTGPGLLEYSIDTVTSETTIAAAPATPTYADTIDLSAEVTVWLGRVPGDVEFFVDGTSLGVAEISASSGLATLRDVELPVGDHTITAVYTGSRHVERSTSSPIVLTVVQAPTTTTLEANPIPVTYGEETVLTATVTGNDPIGDVEFLADGISLGVVSFTDGVASLPVSTLDVGDHEIVADYSGDTNHAASSSEPITLTVVPTPADEPNDPEESEQEQPGTTPNEDAPTATTGAGAMLATTGSETPRLWVAGAGVLMLTGATLLLRRPKQPHRG